MHIYWNDYVSQDLKDFARITKKRNPSQYVKSVWEKIKQLKIFPRIGSVYFYTQNNIIRKLVHKDHIILYYIEYDTINLLLIVHHRQNINSKFSLIRKEFKF